MGKSCRACLAQAMMQVAIGVLILILLKDNPGKHGGIAFLEVVHKLCTAIIHLHLVKAVQFHPGISQFLFQARCSTSTAVLEAKLLVQLVMRQHEELFQVFINLTKAHDTLDRVWWCQGA